MESGEALVYLHPNRPPAYDVAKRLWTMGNFSRFVRPGWRRVECTPAPAKGIYVSAYAGRGDSRLVVVAINENSEDRDVAMTIHGFSSGKVVPYVTSATRNLQPRTSQKTDNNRLVTKLPGQSVVTFLVHPPNGG